MKRAEIGTDLIKAEQILQNGGLVAIPTETVYGLSANALDPVAVARIFEAKDRPSFDPLIVHIPSIHFLARYAAEIPDLAWKLCDAFWPGPLTLLLSKDKIIPDIVTSGLDTVGIRIPAHPMTQALLSRLLFPLAAPSANPFGYISPTTAQHVADQLGDRIGYILDGGHCTVGVESTIVGFEGDKLIIHRLGGITVEQLRQITDTIEIRVSSSSKPDAPGQLDAHYAPRTKLLIGDIELLLEENYGKKLSVISLHKSYPRAFRCFVLSPSGELSEAAANLFGMMREADQSGADLIIAEEISETGLGRAIADRLKRAAYRI